MIAHQVAHQLRLKGHNNKAGEWKWKDNNEIGENLVLNQMSPAEEFYKWRRRIE